MTKKKTAKEAPVEVVNKLDPKAGAREEIKKAFADYKVTYPELYVEKNKEAELERRLAEL